ncbi:hypothetical protein WA026_009592 [Henosepilachna vigintioctopunctata]|uniref:MADF domain-containing protein n=1 Tax=Henosepilachna vigintioctopunctata TaxID=420089 RepID=A0AAW1U8Z4_9CUCU
MDNHLHNLNGHQKFLREFISLYKQQECLWNRSHPNYKNRNDRTEAYEILLKKCKEYIPDADEDYVRLRIDSMRSTFRKERKKVLSSRGQNPDSKDVYKPSLWYYDLLLFTTGETCEDQESSMRSEISVEESPEDYNVVKIPFWGREYSSLAINLYKKYTCLYSLTDPNYKSKHKRNEAIKSITEELMTKTGKIFLQDDVRRKIHLLRGQFMYEYRKIQKHKQAGNDISSYRPSLWCFNMLTFLKKHIVKMESMLKKKDEVQSQRQSKRLKMTSGSISSEQDYNNIEDLKRESDSVDDDHDNYNASMDNMDTESFEHVDIVSQSTELGKSGLDIKDTDDVFDTIGKVMAKRLRDMTTEQNNIAQRLIHDLMYHGQMENLTPNSKLVL